MKKVFSLLFLVVLFTALVGRAHANQAIVLDPIGTNIIDSSGTVYMIGQDYPTSAPPGRMVRMPYTSAGAFLSYSFNSFGKLSKNASGFSYPVGSFIPPRDGKVICSDRGSDKSTCYLITNETKAGFVSEAVFKGLGYSFSNVLYGDVSFLSPTGNITSSSEFHPQGTVINLDNKIYYVQQNPFTNGVPNLEAFTDSAAYASWGYSASDVVPANAADRAISILTQQIPARVEGQLIPDRPNDYLPPAAIK